MAEELAQRLSVERLQSWQALQYGMFLHFSINTYDGVEHSEGKSPPSLFNPAKLDVAQWIKTAKEAGMRYAVLTAKHDAGFCLWPSDQTDYHVGNSPVEVDIVGEFVSECHQQGIRPGLYYCSWDNHHTFGDPNLLHYWGKVDYCFHHYPITRQYEDFQTAQITELLTKYPDLEELWIDIPMIHSPGYRRDLYRHCANLQPEMLIITNNGMHEKQGLVFEDSWPTDVMTIERNVPLVHGWDIEQQKFGWNARLSYLDDTYYIPAEVCDTIGTEWFYSTKDKIRHPAEVAGMVNITLARNANMLLNVGPSRDGIIEPAYVDALTQVRDRLEFLSE